MKKSFVLIAAIASTALAVTAVPALGGGQPDEKVKVATTIIVHEGSGGFFGRVESNQDACVKQRTVRVRKGRNNDRVEGLSGPDLTNNKGKWRVIVDRARGNHRVVVKKQTHGNYVCERAERHIIAQ